MRNGFFKMRRLRLLSERCVFFNLYLSFSQITQQRPCLPFRLCILSVQIGVEQVLMRGIPVRRSYALRVFKSPTE